MDPNKSKCKIEFVHVGQENAAGSASCTTVARSHVMKRFHRQKQLTTRENLQNFCHVTTEQIQKKLKRRAPHEIEGAMQHPGDTIAVERLDPFDCFAADTSELPILLENRKFASLGNIL